MSVQELYVELVNPSYNDNPASTRTQADWNQTDTTSSSYIKNVPETLKKFSVSNGDLMYDGVKVATGSTISIISTLTYSNITTLLANNKLPVYINTDGEFFVYVGGYQSKYAFSRISGAGVVELTLVSSDNTITESTYTYVTQTALNNRLASKADTTDVYTLQTLLGGHTVGKDVPANAVFTDTVYDDTEVTSDIEALENKLPDTTGLTGKNSLVYDSSSSSGSWVPYGTIELNNGTSRYSKYSISEIISMVNTEAKFTFQGTAVHHLLTYSVGQEVYFYFIGHGSGVTITDVDSLSIGIIKYYYYANSQYAMYRVIGQESLFEPEWDNVQNKPSTFTPESHTHAMSEVTGLSNAISGITGLIPDAATSSNQLADKAFVNSSISTNTATFRGTFNNVTGQSGATTIASSLGSSVTPDINDYAFIVVYDSVVTTQVKQYDRYKYNGTTWEFEYTLNNSSFTSDQWSAIQSGITPALVAQISTNAAAIQNQAAMTDSNFIDVLVELDALDSFSYEVDGVDTIIQDSDGTIILC